MSEAQRELAGLLRDVRPGPRYSRPTRGAGPTKPPRGGRAQSSGRLFEALPDWIHVDLPSLPGSAAVVAFVRKRYPLGTVSTREHEPVGCVECVHCGAPRVQELKDRTFGGGETWDVYPCFDCPGNQGDTVQ